MMQLKYLIRLKNIAKIISMREKQPIQSCNLLVIQGVSSYSIQTYMVC